MFDRFMGIGDIRARRLFSARGSSEIDGFSKRDILTMNQANGHKLEINYPCHWQYRLIGDDRDAMMEAIHSIVDSATCTITEGNVSAGGRYRSINLECSVNDEAERLHLYQLFSKHPAIRIVL
jgi:putative lipoic acid-binding regulatory protein